MHPDTCDGCSSCVQQKGACSLSCHMYIAGNVKPIMAHHIIFERKIFLQSSMTAVSDSEGMLRLDPNVCLGRAADSGGGWECFGGCVYLLTKSPGAESDSVAPKIDPTPTLQ